jgi:hypothetical protein
MFVVAPALTLLLAAPAQAQLNGSHTLGDFGVQSGSQPLPGFYAALFYLRYDADTIKDADGNVVRVSPNTPGSIAVSAVAPLAWYVSKAKVLGANYGAMVVLPLANASIEAPAFAIGKTVETSLSDLLVRPLDLGWHAPRADVTTGLQIHAEGRMSAAAATTSGRACDFTAVPGHDCAFRREADRQSRRHGLLSQATRRTPTSRSARLRFKAASASRSSEAD